MDNWDWDWDDEIDDSTKNSSVSTPQKKNVNTSNSNQVNNTSNVRHANNVPNVKAVSSVPKESFKIKDKTKAYFTVQKKKKYDNPIRSIISGAIAFISFAVFFVMLSSHSEIVAGIASLFFLIAIGAIIALLYFLCATEEFFLTGAEYDALVLKYLRLYGSNPQEYLGLDETEICEIEPISFEGYSFKNASNARCDRDDKLWRTDRYEKLIVFFTQNEIHMYKINLNTLTEKIIETTNVVFYEDIVSLSTELETETFQGKTHEYISFNITTKGGNTLNVALKGTKDVQRSVNAMRAMVKEKKLS